MKEITVRLAADMRRANHAIRLLTPLVQLRIISFDRAACIAARFVRINAETV